jgi:hypothetical protein
VTKGGWSSIHELNPHTIKKSSIMDIRSHVIKCFWRKKFSSQCYVISVQHIGMLSVLNVMWIVLPSTSLKNSSNQQKFSRMSRATALLHTCIWSVKLPYVLAQKAGGSLFLSQLNHFSLITDYQSDEVRRNSCPIRPKGFSQTWGYFNLGDNHLTLQHRPS